MQDILGKKRARGIAALTVTAASLYVLSLAEAGITAAADLTSTDVGSPSYKDPVAYDWTGFYFGGHLGYNGGNSKWAVTGNDPGSGNLNFSQGVDLFSEAGSWNEGVQFGYNAMLRNRLLLGAEADFSFLAYQLGLPQNSQAGTSTGAAITYGNGSNYLDTLLASGTVRGRIGYAPGNWLFYATGGLAWTTDQVTLTQGSTGNSGSSNVQRLGWTAGVGAEFPITGHWTGKFEYLYSDYGSRTVNFAALGDKTVSNLDLQQVRVGVNYQFGQAPNVEGDGGPAVPNLDWISFHGQTTLTEQGYPGFRSASGNGPQSLPYGGEARETYDLTLYAGFKLWQGAEVWANPEIDQGYGVGLDGGAHGLAGFASAESYKLGFSEPYARVQRFFLRQTIDLGGETQKVDADTNVFEGTASSDRLVLTIGKFQVVDLFDTNKYANNAKLDFLNWTSVNTGSFDYAGDAWAFTFGAAAEWYTGPWTVRGGFFDLSRTPAAGGNFYGGSGYESDPRFVNYELLTEIERRYEVWGEPGKVKVTGYLLFGNSGDYNEAIRLYNTLGPAAANPGPGSSPADYYINETRKYRTSPGINFNTEQSITDVIAIFARAGWADGQHEPWNNTDVDYSGQLGTSIKGTNWGRPDDTFAISGTVNGITKAYSAWLNQGGDGILIGDGPGNLPHPGLEYVLETYYSYALSSSTRLTFNYQFIENPAYNTDKGPANIFAGRFRWQF